MAYAFSEILHLLDMAVLASRSCQVLRTRLSLRLLAVGDGQQEAFQSGLPVNLHPHGRLCQWRVHNSRCLLHHR